MPNYDLKCTECNEEFKTRASMKEKTEKNIVCPVCGSRELETVFTAPPAYVKNIKAMECPSGSSCAGCPRAV